MIFNSLKRLFARKRETCIENLIGELTQINAYAKDAWPVVLEFKMKYSDGDEVTHKFGLGCSDAEFLLQRMQYLLSGVSDISGIDFNNED